MNRDRVAGFAAAIAIFLIIFGAKLSLIREYSMPHPFWDAWHVEGIELYKPFLTGTLTLSDLTKPASASEHRPVLLRLDGLLLLALNKQWDVQLQMVVNAAWFGLLGCVLYRLLAAGFGPVGQTCIAAVVLTGLVVPSGWENTLNGHHAGWFYFYLFSVAGLWLTVSQVPLSRRWAAGAVSMALAYFSLFAGILSIAGATAALALRGVCERRLDRRLIIAVVVLGSMFVAGMAIRPRFASETASNASSISAFFTALGYGMSWPHSEVSVYAMLQHAPAAILIALMVMRRLAYTAHRGFVAAVALWAWLQALGIAYARGADGMPTVIRYMDLLTFGLLAAVTAALVLVTASSGVWRRLAAIGLLALWVLSVGSGLHRRTAYTYADALPEQRRSAMAQDFNLRSFLATRNLTYLDHKPEMDIGYYYYVTADQFAKILTDPVIAEILPASIRQPLPVQWAAARNAGAASAPAPPPSELPDHDAQTTFTSAGRAAVVHLESDWLAPPQLPYLQFRVAGNLGRPGISVDLVTISGETIHLRSPDMPPRGWTTIEVPSPRARFHVVAVDDSPTAWVTFSAPREMGRLSYYAKSLLERSEGVVLIGYASAILFLIVQIRRALDLLPARKALP